MLKDYKNEHNAFTKAFSSVSMTIYPEEIQQDPKLKNPKHNKHRMLVKTEYTCIFNISQFSSKLQSLLINVCQMFQSHCRSGLLHILHTHLANAFLKTATQNRARRLHWHILASFAINVLLRKTLTPMFHFILRGVFKQRSLFSCQIKQDMHILTRREFSCQTAVQKSVCSAPLPIKAKVLSSFSLSVDVFRQPLQNSY